MVTRNLYLFAIFLTLVSTFGFAQVEEHVSYYSSNQVLEHVIIDDSLHYRIEFREYPDMGKKAGPGKWKYFEFDCAERLGPVVRKVRITSGWGMRVRDEEMDSAKRIKYEYTYLNPSGNLENRSKKYFDKLISLTHPGQLLEILEIKEILAANQRRPTQVEYYLGDSLLVSRVEVEDGKRKQVDSASYEGGRLAYMKGEYGSAHYFRYDLDSAGKIDAMYDSTQYEKSITRYRLGKPILTTYMTAWGEVKGRERTTYSGDTLTTEAYYSAGGALLGSTLHRRRWNARRSAYSYSLNGTEVYTKQFDKKGRVVREIWRLWDGRESIRTHMYLSDK